jgi:hypothetical protein
VAGAPPEGGGGARPGRGGGAAPPPPPPPTRVRLRPASDLGRDQTLAVIRWIPYATAAAQAAKHT